MKKNFINWGIKVKKIEEKNYFAIWQNLKTLRLDIGPEIQLSPNESEFYDVSLGNKCNAECEFCYAEASKKGECWENICETWKNWMSTFPEDTKFNDPAVFNPIKKEDTEDTKEVKLRFQLAKRLGIPIIETKKPFQISIGSGGEPTIHPDFCKFLETVYMTGVVPNYTTNGIMLIGDQKDKILEATNNFCGGVAVSLGNRGLHDTAIKAVENLLKFGDCAVMLHHIISDKASVDEFIKIAKSFGEDIHYNILLPLMKHGRSEAEMTEDTYLYLCDKIQENADIRIGMGANFTKWMKKYPERVKTYSYPEEFYSHNILLRDKKITITPNSYNLNSIYVWN